jgi:6-phosphogluconolactonase
MVFYGTLIVSPSKADVPNHLNLAIVDICVNAIKARGVFSVALSGGSLPSFLSNLRSAFETKGINPCFDLWHVVLADERCVPSTDPDSNLGTLQTELFSSISVPVNQIYGINENKLAESTEAIAKDYELVVKHVLGKSGGQLDLAVLGFGPDGHTCSLFPGHALLHEECIMVAPIEDSPKHPPCRITLTYPVLNTLTRHVVFCGAGDSKAPILQAIFHSVSNPENALNGSMVYTVIMKEPYPYPCGGVLPNSKGTENTLTWVVDNDAMVGVRIS